MLPTFVPTSHEPLTSSVSLTLSGMSGETFANSTALQGAFRAALAYVLGVPLSHIGALRIMGDSVLPKSHEMTSSANPWDRMSQSDKTVVQTDISSDYDAANTEEVLIDAESELMEAFVSAARNSSYTGSVKSLEAVSLVGVSSKSLAPTPSPTAEPSERPTRRPSASPTKSPTPSPSFMPTMYPHGDTYQKVKV